eukprot:SAG11_NODE_16778_length_538_cov_0.594533_2_plen_75_part_01
MIEACAQHGIRVHVAGIWSGLHHTNAGGVGVLDAAEQGSAEQEAQARIEGWSDLAKEHNCSLAAVAVALAMLPSA